MQYRIQEIQGKYWHSTHLYVKGTEMCMHACLHLYMCTMAHAHPLSFSYLWWILNCAFITYRLHSWMHSQILFPSSIPASHPLTQLTHSPSRWSGLAPTPSFQSCAPRHMPPHPCRTVGYPPQSVGQYQGRCAFTVGWVQEPALSLPTPILHTWHLYCTVTNTGNSAHKHGFV